MSSEEIMKQQLKSRLDAMMRVLDEPDRERFDALATRMQEVAGDASKLTLDERQFIAQMDQKYGDKLQQAASSVQNPANELPPQQANLIATPFGQFVKARLAQQVQPAVNSFNDAVTFAFNSKWLPDELKEQQSCEAVFRQYREDIELANQWRHEIALREDSRPTDEEVLAVGLAWFMVIYQLKYFVDRGEELSPE